MKQFIASWCLGIVLLTALYECATAPLPTAQDIGNLRSTEVACKDWADAWAPFEGCIGPVHAAFCAKFSTSCIDGGLDQ